MNLVHRVGVVFSAHDHISNRLKKMGEGMLGLEKRKTSLEKSLGGLAKQEERLIKMQERAGTANMQAALRQQAMHNTIMRQRQAFATLQSNVANKELAAMRTHSELQQKLQNSDANLRAKHANLRQAQLDKHSEAEAAAVRKNVQVLEAANKKVRDLEGKGAQLVRGGAQRMTPQELARSGGRQANLRTMISRQRQTAMAAGQAAVQGLTGTASDEAAASAMAPHNRIIAQLQKQLSLDEARVKKHHDLTTQVEDLGRANADVARLEREHIRIAADLHREQRQAADDMLAAHQRLETEKRHGDAAEIARSRQIYEEKQQQNEELVRKQRAHLHQAQTLHTQKNDLIEREGELRERNLQLAHQELQQKNTWDVKS